MSDLRSFIETLRRAGDLIEVSEPLSPLYEIPFAIRCADQQKGAAVLFHRVQGHARRVVGGVLGRKRRLALALGVAEDRIGEAYRNGRANPIPPHIAAGGPVHEAVIEKEIDILGSLPVLTHHQKDAGPYITCGVVLAKDPDTGVRGVGIHRIQVRDRETVRIYLASPPLSTFWQKAEGRNRPLDIAVVIGPDPVTFFSSVIWAPAGIDKFDIAGGLRGVSVPLVKARSVDLEVPAEAEFVLEGRVLPGVREKDGPFGETTGYYFSDQCAVARIQAITHRRDAIYQALMPFCSEELVLLSFSWELDQLQELQGKFPFVRQVHFKSIMGLVTVVQVRKEAEGDGPEIIRHLFGHPFMKVIIVVDEDVNPEDAGQVEWAVATRVQPDRDILIESGRPGFMIDPSAGREGSKVGIDATKPLRELDRFERIEVPEEAKARARAILQKYGLS